VSTFEFVSVLMSIVVGLGITRILSSLTSLIDHRAKSNLDGISLLWAFNILGMLLIFWWVVVNNWRIREVWSLAGFAALFLYGVGIYFCAALILPRVDSEGVDLRARFERIRVPFFLFWLFVVLLELFDSLLKGGGYVLSELGPPYIMVIGSSLVLGVIALRVRSRRFHWVFALWTCVTFTAWVLSRFSQI
jgi:hypothetical protein